MWDSASTVLFVAVIMIMLCIFPKQNRDIKVPLQQLPTQTRECNRPYLLNSLGLVGNICIGKLWIIGVYNIFSPHHCVAVIYFDLRL